MDIVIKHLDKSYEDLQLYRDFSLRLRRGKITAITGESGCGKTTLLRLLAGLEAFDSGEIDGLMDCSIRGCDRRTAFVFQEDRLLPWLTVAENMDLVMRAFMEKQQREKRLSDILHLLKLQEYREFYPHALSGGMQRRVAIGRALAFDGDLLLMDEPFKGLDEKLRITLREELMALWEKKNQTVVLVTHDLHEARLMAHEIFVLKGRPVTAAVEG